MAGGPRQGVDIVVGRYKQEWRIQSNGNQFVCVNQRSGSCLSLIREVFRIYYPDTNFALDLSGASSGNGTKILLWTAHGRSNQSWIPEPLNNGPPPGDNKPLQNNTTYLARLILLRSTGSDLIKHALQIRNAKTGTVAAVSDENHGAHNHKVRS